MPGLDASTVARYLAGDRQTARQVEEWVRVAASGYRRRLDSDWEDAVQDTCLELTRLLKSGRFRGEAKLRTYAWRVTNSVCIDRLRRRRPETVGLEQADVPSGEPSALAQALRTEAARLALRIVAQMSAECRNLWAMILDGLSYKDMSDRTGAQPGALRVRVLRCRRRAEELRRELQNPESAEGV